MWAAGNSIKTWLPESGSAGFEFQHCHLSDKWPYLSNMGLNDKLCGVVRIQQDTLCKPGG